MCYTLSLISHSDPDSAMQNCLDGGKPPAGKRELSGLELVPARTFLEKIVGLQLLPAIPFDLGLVFFLDPPLLLPVIFHSFNCRFAIGLVAVSAAGKILRLADLQPGSIAVMPRGTRIVLETSAGWFAFNGWKEGDLVAPGSITASASGGLTLAQARRSLRRNDFSRRENGARENR